MAQFAYNSAKSEPIGMSPFYANYGYEPEAYRQPRKDETMSEKAIVTVEKLKDLQQQLSKDIEFKNKRIAAYANKKRSIEPSLEKGDKVYLLRKNIKTKRPNGKLDFKKLGLFEILEKIGLVNFKLRLPPTSRLHLVFHVSLLEPAIGKRLILSDKEIQPENDPDVYEVEKIIDVRRTAEGGQKEYLIKWKRYDDIENI